MKTFITALALAASLGFAVAPASAASDVQQDAYIGSSLPVHNGE